MYTDIHVGKTPTQRHIKSKILKSSNFTHIFIFIGVLYFIVSVTYIHVYVSVLANALYILYCIMYYKLKAQKTTLVLLVFPIKSQVQMCH